MRARTRPLDYALLIVALIGPLFHLLGLFSRGTNMLYTDYSRLAVIYVGLALSAAVGAYLVLRRQWAVVRLLAGLALVVNIGSVAYASNLWSRHMGESLLTATMPPFDSAQVGVLVAPADHSDRAITEARSIERLLREMVQSAGLEDYISVRRVYPLASEKQADRLGQRMRANVVLWSQPADFGRAKDYYVTVLGTNETPIDLEPLSLMLLMSTQDTFTLRVPLPPDEAGLPALVNQVVLPVTAGFAFLSASQPVYAAAQFEGAYGVADLPTAAAQQLHHYRGVALLLANRPDLAMIEYETMREMGENAYTWVGIGNVYVARREWQAAGVAYQRALELDPYRALPYCGLGIIATKEHHVARALAAYQQAVALQPELGTPYALLAQAHELEANVDAAWQAYQTCAALSGPNVGLYVAVLDRAEEVKQNPPTAVPTATVPPLPTPTPRPTEELYYVQRGDTLQVIADEFGVTVEAIVQANELEDANSIYIGQGLYIPEAQ
ncbi:MAG: LysM peptidoglycan-binding domain-containing protein [Chloroflexi bacterium]|nr:LysM peptidoglycan-binding domain-containing protein [Chloroflexota bacterium]